MTTGMHMTCYMLIRAMSRKRLLQRVVRQIDFNVARSRQRTPCYDGSDRTLRQDTSVRTVSTRCQMQTSFTM
jgi:hypothetical protein